MSDASRSPSTATRRCAWCRGPIPDGMRRDAVCCSVSCRQARHRFTSGVGVSNLVAETPLRLAYADPPYPGRARRYYGSHPDYAGDVDHAALIAHLEEFDGWALSTAADSLQDVLALCPAGARVGVWVRGARVNRRAVRPLNAWEPVIYFGGRAVAQASTTRVDVLSHGPGVRRTDPARVIGAKPAAFARWVFDLLGARAGDELVDLFPGSGGIARAWDVFASQPAADDA